MWTACITQRRERFESEFMSIELKVPETGEPITEVEIGGWLKKTRRAGQADEPIVTLESDKAIGGITLTRCRNHRQGFETTRRDGEGRGSHRLSRRRKRMERKRNLKERRLTQSLRIKRFPKTLGEAGNARGVWGRGTLLAPRPAQVKPAQDRPRSERLRGGGKRNTSGEGKLLALRRRIRAKSAHREKKLRCEQKQSAAGGRQGTGRADGQAAAHGRRTAGRGAAYRRLAHHLQRDSICRA